MEVALVGGGRWAKVLCNALTPLPGVDRIHLVSRRNMRGMREWLERQPATPGRFVIHDALEDVLKDRAVGAALVANLPADHFRTTARLLDHDKHVLVEKPFVPTETEAQVLIDVAFKRGLVLAVGLEFFFAAYLHRFKQAMGDVESCEVTWHDVSAELRWGVEKRPEATTGAVGDILPHVLTLLTVLLGRQHVIIDMFETPDGGESALLRLSFGPYPVRVSLSRVAPVASRRIEIRTREGERSSLDFTQEPRDVLTPAPLDAEICGFLEEIESLGGVLPNLAQYTLHIVAGTQAACIKAKAAQVALLRAELAMAPPRDPSWVALVALREHLAGPLLEAGLVESPKDADLLAQWTRMAFHVIHRLASRPFTTQRELAAELELGRDALRCLNTALRASDVVQELVLNHGAATKYWRHTIVPLAQSGALEDARAGAWRYPFRIGLYPGQSCMFHCSFCGRHYDSRYPSPAVATGNTILQTILANAPVNDPHRFYLSGGLEPLTNPGLGALVHAGAMHGFRLSLYTNGYMLTPRLLERQPGLWELDTLRISLYGVDRETTARVTRNSKAFDLVTDNALKFLALRNERDSTLRIGFNFVILPGSAAQVIALAELIATLNREAGGRPVDFLTLREDFSVKSEDGIPPAERVELARIFAWLEARRREPDLQGLHVDYGYALQALRDGADGCALEMADRASMRPRGYPQISVVVDLLGDVYLYREAGFIERPGAARYAVGRVSAEHPFEHVLREFVDSGRAIEPHEDDTRYFDIFDHVITRLLAQADADAAYGIPLEHGPVRGRARGAAPSVTLAHPTLS